jgi:DNA-directed RNA polymerase subunit H (RpoH/RPB5)
MDHRKVRYNHTFLTSNEFSKIFNHTEFIKIDGLREDKHGKRLFSIILIAPESKYSNNMTNFKRLLNNNYTPGTSTELVIISENPLTNFIQHEIVTQRNNNPTLYLEHYTYDLFSQVIPDAHMYSPCSIATDEEVEELTTYHRMKKNTLSEVLLIDPAVIWLGARVDDVLVYNKPSDGVGEIDGYRIVRM